MPPVENPAKDLVFVVSGGRTGTKFFGTVLGTLIDGCFSVHEPDMVNGDLTPRGLVERIGHFGFHHMVTGRLLGTRGVRILSDRYLRGGIGLEDAAATIRAWRDRYHAAIDRPLIVESCSQWYGLLPPLRAAWPQARVVAIVRDPRGWIQSSLNHGRRRGFRDLVEWVGQKRISPAMLGDDEWAGRWPAMSAFQRLCWDWTTINRLLDDFVAGDAHARLYRFEDLFDPERPEVRRDLLDFVADHGRYRWHEPEAAFRRRLNASRGGVPDWTQWPPAEVRFLHEVCGPQMERYGYGTEPEWRRMLAPETAGA